jgi:hypothetical protein
LESQWTFEFYKGQKSMAWKTFYIIGTLLERSYGQKKGQESNWQFNSQSLKVGNQPDFRACRWRATYRWKALDKGYNFTLDLISIRGMHAKLWRPKVAGILTLAISGLPLGSPKTKSHLDVGPVERCRVYYKGEGGDFPQVWAMVNLVCLCCSWLVLGPKVFQLCNNHLLCASTLYLLFYCFLFRTHIWIPQGVGNAQSEIFFLNKCVQDSSPKTFIF